MESARPWKRVTPVTGSSPGRIWQWLEPSGGRIQWSWGWGARRRGRCRAPRCTPSTQSGQGSLCGTPFCLWHWYHLIIAILVDCWRWLRRYFMITLVKIMLPNIKILLVVLKREAWQGWKLGLRVKCKGARSSCSWTLICCNLLTLIWYKEHTSNANICWNMKFPKYHSKIFWRNLPKMMIGIGLESIDVEMGCR